MLLSVIIPLLLAAGAYSQSLLDIDTSTTPTQAFRSRSRRGLATHHQSRTHLDHQLVARGTTWNYLACYEDGSDRALPYVTNSNTLTPEGCQATCQAQGYIYAGMENGSQCYCGNVIKAGYRQVSAAECGTGCSGDSSKKCGGVWRLSVYQSFTTTSTLPAGVYSVGCFRDAGTMRFVLSSGTVNSALTPGFCTDYCKARGYSIAGAQNGNECYCNNTVDMSLKQADGDCSLQCAGDNGFACGGPGRMMVYSSQPSTTTASTTTPSASLKPLPSGIYSVGCYRDAGTMRFVISSGTVNSALTPGFCTDHCKARGYSIAGAQNGNECYCNNSVDTSLKQADGDCSLRCAGDSGYACGGPGRMMVYSSTAPTTTAPATTPSSSLKALPAGVYSVGCFRDAGTMRFVISSGTQSSALTPAFCTDYCKNRGYSIAGAQNANECYCNNSVDTSLKQADGDCSLRCAGDSGYACGGPGRMAVYSSQPTTTTAPTTSAPATTTAPSTPLKSLPAGVNSIGCFRDAGTMGFVSSSITKSSAMTPAFCTDYCKVRGYTIAGAQNANECYCSNDIDWSLKQVDGDCSVRCAGDNGYACGGPGRMMVYSSSSALVTGAPQPVSAGRKWLWSHYMVGNTENHTPQIWEEDIRLAAAAGIDGFALNMGQAAWQIDRVATAYQTAYNLRATYAFKLFLSFDMTAMYCQSENDARYLASIVSRFASNPYQAWYKDKVLVTTFAGDQCRFGRGSALDGWNFFRSLLTAQNIPIFLMPSLFVDVYGSANNWYDGHFDWDSAWPLTGNNLDGSRDQGNIATLNSKGKGYMANISPAFFTYYGSSGQFAYNKNWIYRSDNWLLATRFETLMGMRGQLDMIELTSWNGSQAWVNGLPHTAWLSVVAYYAPAWKTGVYPTAKDKIILWSRTHPKNGTPTNPTLSRPRDADWTDDNLYAMVILSSPAVVEITSGGTAVRYANLPAGITKISLSSRPGIIGGQISRSGQTVTRWSSENVFNWSTTFRDWNFNYFVQAF